MIVNTLAALGGYYLASKAARLCRWYFFIDRSGNSGRSARHWSEG